MRCDLAAPSERHVGLDPTCRHTGGGGAQIAARVGDHDLARDRQGGQELAVDTTCGHVARGQSGGSAVRVAHEGIRDRWRWEQPVDCSDDDDEVDVEAGGTGECAGGEPGTDATLAWWRHLELGEKRRAELATVHGRTDGVEVAEPVEDTFDLLVSGTLGVVEPLEGAAPDPSLDLLAAPGRPLVPGPGGGRVTER